MFLTRRHCSLIQALLFGLLLGCICQATTPPAHAQELTADDAAIAADDAAMEINTPEKIDVEPLAEDQDISARLERIFAATGWFDSPQVSTDEGVVFLSGVADSERHREWAERVAQRTSDVVAVVNQITVRAGPVWDIQPAVAQLKQLGRDSVQLIPLLAVGALVLLVSYGLAKLSASGIRRLAARRIDSLLLQQVVSSVVAVMVMVIGLYIALKVSDLSRLAVTVLGGTGLVGLALGFAFRDIAENYLASILRLRSDADHLPPVQRRRFDRTREAQGICTASDDPRHRPADRQWKSYSDSQ